MPTAARRLPPRPGSTAARAPASRHALAVLALLSIPILLGAASTAQPEDEDRRERGIFVDTLDVSVVNIEVRVSRDGEPVTGLGPDDFELLDDGVPMPITQFYRVESGQRSTPDEPASTGAPTSSRQGESESEAIEGVREPATVVVLVDHDYLTPMSRQLVFERLEARLDTLFRGGAQVMVVSKTGKIELAQPMTDDRAEVERTLDRLAGLSTPGYAAEVLQTIQRIQDSGAISQGRAGAPGASATGSATTSEADARSAYLEAQAHSQREYAAAGQSLRLLRHFVGAMAGVSGRKAVVYVADRLPVRSGELAWAVWFDLYGFDWGTQFGVPSAIAATAQFDLSAEVAELLAEASANRVAFYPVGAGADAGPNLIGAESRTRPTTTGSFTRATESNEGLRWMAEGTGGRVALGRGDLGDFVEQLGRDLGHYYSLGYRSPHRGDGRDHTVEVRLLRQDLQGSDVELGYSSTYRDKSNDHLALEETLAALVLGAGENPLGVRVAVGESRPGDGGRVEVPVEIRVPVANLVLLPGRESHRGEVTVHLVVRNAEGRLAEPVRVRVPIEIPNAGLLQALSDSAVYRTELTVRSGRQTLAVGVHDDLAALGSTVRVPIETGGEVR